jgi:DNA-binding NarL/FixJ family response regulator
LAGLIAVVEDEPELLALYRIMLASKGYAIAFMSADADEAVDNYACCKKKPDLVIMDRRLKQSSGIDAACRIAAIDPAARILFATADADRDLAAGVPGVVGILQKPFPMGAFFMAIECALARDDSSPCPRRHVPSLA